MKEHKNEIIFLWNNFGPMHADRVDAVAKKVGEHAHCIGLELYPNDETYSWESENRNSFEKIVVFPNGRPGLIKRIAALIKYGWKYRRAMWFLCHYERPEVLFLALFLRLLWTPIFTMGCSKFDDLPRNALKEGIKSLALAPYKGAISSGGRPADFFRFRGFPRDRVALQYNTLSVARMQYQASDISSPEFTDRDWVIVARLVPKKNLAMALDAYALYKEAGGERRLHLLGNGPLEEELRQKANELHISENINFHGFVQSVEVSRHLKGAMALILPSTEEQFGNVVIEAQSFGVPVLISVAAGAADQHVRNWVNGFVFEPDNPKALACFMQLIDKDPDFWAELSEGANEYAPKGDVDQFASGVLHLIRQIRPNFALPQK